MSCTFCKKTDSTLVVHSMCGCCLVHLECCEATPENRLATNSTRVIPEDEDEEVDMRVCDICLEEYERDELEGHRGTCMARLVLRCVICNGDYVSKEGMWNHFVEHQIPDGSEESYYKEIRVTQKLHICVLCNDQRAYQESAYWNHVHEDHDGFFLRCSECDENFRSEKLKLDHSLNHCKERKTTGNGESNSDVLDAAIIQIQPNKITVPVEEPSDNTRRKCEICGRFFAKLCNYNYHMITYHTDPQYQCPKCPRKFHLEHILQLHLLNLHTEEQCPGESETKSFIDSGERSSVSTPENTSDRMDEERDLPSVENVEEPSDNTRLKCKICGRFFAKLCNYNYHMITYHTDPQYKCPKCPRKFHLEHILQLHLLNLHTEEQCPEESEAKSFVDSGERTLENTSDGMDEERDLPSVENEDSQSSTTLSEQETEQSSSAADQSLLKLSRLNCPYCSRKYYGKLTLARHISRNHKPSKCDICGATQSSKAKLGYHKLKFHTEAQYKCLDCPKQFRQMSEYQRHLKKHREKDKFSCYLCHQSFGSLRLLDAHKKQNLCVSKVQVDSREDTKCPHCHMQCYQAKYLLSHINDFHEPMSCDVCNSTFSGTIKLQHHKFAAHGIYRHECDFCSKKFQNTIQFHRHIERHKRARKYCRYCDRTFKTLEDLRSHEEDCDWRFYEDNPEDHTKYCEKEQQLEVR